MLDNLLVFVLCATQASPAVAVLFFFLRGGVPLNLRGLFSSCLPYPIQPLPCLCVCVCCR